MAEIGLIGYGIVGQATEYGFKDKNNIHIYDKFKESDTLERVCKNSEFIFVGLPTPFKEKEMKIDLSIIDDAVSKITPVTNNTNKIIVLKSTVVPGTTANYIDQYPCSNFCFNPEFLTEANYLEDFVNADHVVIGSDNTQVGRRVAELYLQSMPKIPIQQTDPTSAEMVKYVKNTYLSTKVIFANEMHSLAEKLGIDYSEVKKIVVADHRIYDSHLDVTKERGFGGKCFPKDIVALIGKYNDLGVPSPLLDAVWKRNLEIRKNRDWEDIPFVVSED